MSEHFTRNTEWVWTWCGVCQRMTERAVSAGIAGACRAHKAKTLTRAQQERRAQAQRPRQGNLFEKGS